MKGKTIVIILNFLLDLLCHFLLIHSFYIFYISGLLVKELKILAFCVVSFSSHNFSRR